MPRPHTRDRDLLAINITTTFVLTESGRIQRENDPDRSPGPRLYIAGCKSGNLTRIRHDVGEATSRAIDAIVANEPPLGDPDSAPHHLDDYVDLLAAEAPVEQQSAGLTYCFPDHLVYDHDVTLVRSDTPEGDRLLAGLATNQAMPQTLLSLGFVAATDFWAPWCVALHGGEVASIRMTARIGPAGAAASITTVPALRGRGFAAAAVAGWASHPSLRGRALSYDTDRTYISSQRVAERLGLRFVGASLRVT